MTDKAKLEEIKKLADAMYYAAFNMTTDASILRKAMNEYNQFIINEDCKEEPVSEDLEEACEQLSEDARKHKAETSSPFFSQTDYKQGVMDGAKWQKANLWKPADGDDLPIIDREVVVLFKYSTQRNIHDKEYSTYRVGFGHRPNPNGWDGKNIDTNEVTHYTPKLYDKGGWNAPDIAYWLDVRLPKEIEL